MKRVSRETRQQVIGAVTCLIIAAVFVAGYRDGPGTDNGEGYRVYAIYDTAIGLTQGSDVMMSGIPVGEVGGLRLIKESNEALVEIVVDPGVEIPADSEASIISEGLSGGKYIRIVPGGEFEMLQPEETFAYSRSSVDFLELFERIVQMAEARAERRAEEAGNVDAGNVDAGNAGAADEN